MICPCENCICISVCRHKQYMLLFQNCTILKEFESRHNIIEHRAQEKIILLEKVLQPTRWFVNFRESDGLVWIGLK